MKALIDGGFFRMLQPGFLGGAESRPVLFTQVTEAFAAANASVAWCVGQNNGCSMTAAYLDREVACEIFGPPTGTWAGDRHKYRTRRSRWTAAIASAASGASPAAVRTRSGSARICRSLARARCARCCFPKASVQVNDIWHTVGLRDGQQRIRHQGPVVPQRFSSSRDNPAERREDGLLYRFTSNQLYSCGFAGVGSGIARGTINDFLDLPANKVSRGAMKPMRENNVVQSQLAQSEARSAIRARLPTPPGRPPGSMSRLPGSAISASTIALRRMRASRSERSSSSRSRASSTPPSSSGWRASAAARSCSLVVALVGRARVRRPCRVCWIAARVPRWIDVISAVEPPDGCGHVGPRPRLPGRWEMRHAIRSGPAPPGGARCPGAQGPLSMPKRRSAFKDRDPTRWSAAPRGATRGPRAVREERRARRRERSTWLEGAVGEAGTRGRRAAARGRPAPSPKEPNALQGLRRPRPHRADRRRRRSAKRPARRGRSQASEPERAHGEPHSRRRRR